MLTNKLSHYAYTLPPELIAHTPTPSRDQARLFVANAFGVYNTDAHFSDLPSMLKPGDVLVLNNTRVLPARLTGWREKIEMTSDGFNKPTPVKGKLFVEVLLHRCLGEGHLWQAFCRPGKKLKKKQILYFQGGEAEVVDRRGEEFILSFKNYGQDFELFLKKSGKMPLPPYIERSKGSTEEDDTRYQTVYAKERGAVAAPTAGLHFTPAILKALEAKGVKRAEVTLHVGAGTFQPVREEDLNAHVMHTEWGEITPEAVKIIQQAKTEGGRVICVGTTSLRLLETAAKTGELKPFQGDTDIFITPGFQFNMADGLLTNFHLPKSTLLMLVAAFMGHGTMKAIYETAIKEKYRFYSYGDSSLLWRQ